MNRRQPRRSPRGRGGRATTSTPPCSSVATGLRTAIQSARRLKQDRRIVVVFPPKRTRDALRKAADASFVLGHGRISGNQLPSTVVGPRADLRRPTHWH